MFPSMRWFALPDTSLCNYVGLLAVGRRPGFSSPFSEMCMAHSCPALRGPGSSRSWHHQDSEYNMHIDDNIITQREFRTGARYGAFLSRGLSCHHLEHSNSVAQLQCQHASGCGFLSNLHGTIGIRVRDKLAIGTLDRNATSSFSSHGR